VRERLRALQPENLRALDRMVGQAAWSS